jgi:SNF2 family DNA or RNA helicase
VQGFTAGDLSVLVSKVKILGYGMNFQHCSHMVFVGLGDSYEQYYQAIRRCWRFGQARPVDVHVVVSEAERLIVENVRRKEATAHAMSHELLAHLRDFEREELVA